jgi:hypothetical protein
VDFDLFELLILGGVFFSKRAHPRSRKKIEMYPPFPKKKDAEKRDAPFLDEPVRV